MAAKRKAKEPDDQDAKLDEVIYAVQDLFILQALVAGIKVDDVRKILKIGKNRVSAISKYIETSKRR